MGGSSLVPAAPQRVWQLAEHVQQVEDMQIADDKEIQKVQLTFVDQSVDYAEDTEFSVVVENGDDDKRD